MFTFDTLVDRSQTGAVKWERRTEAEKQAGIVAMSVADMEFRTREITCGKCANHCEIICVYREKELIDAWGNRCDRGAVR